MKRSLAIALSITVAASFPVHAVDVVFDPVTEANMILQYAAMLEELTVVKDQLENAKDSLKVSRGQLEAIGKGASDLGKDHFEDYTSKIPKNWRETLNVIGDSAESGVLARSIRDENSRLDSSYFEGSDDRTKSALSERMDASANLEGLVAATYQGSSDRFERLESLRKDIDRAEDLKTVADLQARIQIENGMLMNELVKLQSMSAMHQANEKVRSQKRLQESFEQDAVSY